MSRSTGSPDEAHDAAVARLLAEAPHRVRVTVVNQRLAGVPLEPRAATAVFDPATGRYTLHVGSQGAGALRAQLAQIMGLEPGKVRVLTEDVGGAFGLKTPAYPEYPALMAAAKMLGRPVHWAASRSESFVSDNQGRDTVATAELALDAEGRFLALKVDTVANMGAYLSSGGANIATSNFSRCFLNRLPDPGHLHRRRLRLHEHGADRTLSRRRPAGSELRHGAAGRCRSTPNRPRPDRASAAAISSGPRRCRTRRRSAPPSTAASSKPSSTRRSRLADHATFEERRASAASAWEAARHGHFDVPRACRGDGHRERRPFISRAGAADARARRAIVGTGTCDGLPGSARRAPRRAGRPPSRCGRAIPISA